MPILPALRKRKPAQAVALPTILGTSGAIYQYHEGDLFTPGAENFVFESIFARTALQAIWGVATLRRPNTFSPIAASPQVFSLPTVQTNGIGGLEAGYLELQGLIDPNGAGSGIEGGGL